MKNQDAALQAAAENALTSCMGYGPDEALLVITDAGCRPIGEALFAAASALGGQGLLLEMPVAEISGAEPPPAVTAAMAASAVTVCPTSKSLTHTEARRAACRAGGRVATMPGITADCMIRCLAADYERIAKVTERYTERLTAATEAVITCPHGSELRLPLQGIDAIASTGLLREPGQGGNLPSGEAYLMPVEGGAEGILFVDGSMADVGVIGETPLRLEISGGLLRSVSGGPEAERLQARLDTYPEAARNIAELGVGTNDRAEITGYVLEDEKVAGTVHVALGNNIGMGGTVGVALHLDGVLRRPTLTLDGEMVVDAGRLLP